VKNANPHWWSLLLVVIVLAFPLAGCGKKQETSQAETHKTVADFFPIKVGDRVVQMQLAVMSEEMQRGLMGRRDLGPDQGMIFIYPQPERMNFYMHNTPTPLDIGYFTADGRLHEVYPMYPFDEKTISSRSEAIQFSLETNQGWYKANDVKPGAQLDLKALAAAMKARGFEPSEFKLEKREP